MQMMDTEEIEEMLQKRRKQYDECGAAEALRSTVDTDRFYRFVASIADINIRGDAVMVKFDEPVPGATYLDSGYTFNVSCGFEGRLPSGFKCSRVEMPKQDLITLHQVVIVIWAMSTGMVR